MASNCLSWSGVRGLKSTVLVKAPSPTFLGLSFQQAFSGFFNCCLLDVYYGGKCAKANGLQELLLHPREMWREGFLQLVLWLLTQFYFCTA